MVDDDFERKTKHFSNKGKLMAIQLSEAIMMKYFLGFID